MEISIASTCAPSRLRQYKKHGTCFTRKELFDILTQYQKAHPQDATLKPSMSMSIKKLADLVNQAIQTCTRSTAPDACAATQDFAQPLRHALFRDALRPEKPQSWNADRYEWLTNFNIQLVMEQYERATPAFKFLGVVPIDFAAPSPHQTCISPNVCQVRIEDLLNGKKTAIAVVFNLDRHDQPGSHWVCCFAHLEPDHPAFGISYFNSVGLAPPEEILHFMKHVQGQAHSLFPSKPFALVHNTLRKQYGSSECGMFCLLYIIRCLEQSASIKEKNPRARAKTAKRTKVGSDFYKTIFKGMEKDELANRARNVLFTPL